MRREDKTKESANSCERVEQAGAFTMSRVELLNGTGTDGGKYVTLTTDIKLCSKKSQVRADLSASGLMLRKRMTETSKIAPAST